MKPVDAGSYEEYLAATSRDQAAPFDPFNNPDHAKIARIYDPEFAQEEDARVVDRLTRAIDGFTRALDGLPRHVNCSCTIR